MKKANVLALALILAQSPNCLSQNEPMRCMVGTDPGNTSSYGLILPSIGTVKILLVFAQFPDDNFDVANALWPKGAPPQNMSSWINETWTSNPIQGSLTHYFNDMSFNKFKLIGKTASVISPHSRQWYLDNGWVRWDIQKEILQQLDATWDFGEFDQWDADKNNVPDGKVDMIVFIWRNIAMDYPSGSVSPIQLSLNFEHDFGSLGASTESIPVDGGVRHIDGGDWGSGVTVRDLAYWGYQVRFRTVVHEIAHYLIGHNDYHCGFGFWGMLSSYGVRSIVANSFERSKLGWIDLPVITSGSPQTYSNIQLADYVSTGNAYELQIDPSTGESFYIENHQATSYWETNFLFGYIEPGLYFLRKDALTPTTSDDNPSSSFFRMIPADGRFDWNVNQETQNPWGSGQLPVFKNLGPMSKLVITISR